MFYRQSPSQNESIAQKVENSNVTMLSNSDNGVYAAEQATGRWVIWIAFWMGHMGHGS